MLSFFKMRMSPKEKLVLPVDGKYDRQVAGIMKMIIAIYVFK